MHRLDDVLAHGRRYDKRFGIVYLERLERACRAGYDSGFALDEV